METELWYGGGFQLPLKRLPDPVEFRHELWFMGKFNKLLWSLENGESVWLCYDSVLTLFIIFIESMSWHTSSHTRTPLNLSHMYAIGPHWIHVMTHLISYQDSIESISHVCNRTSLNPYIYELSWQLDNALTGWRTASVPPSAWRLVTTCTRTSSPTLRCEGVLHRLHLPSRDVLEWDRLHSNEQVHLSVSRPTLWTRKFTSDAICGRWEIIQSL